MKCAILAVPMMAAVLAVGCAQKQTPPPTSSSALEVTPGAASAPVTTTPGYTPPAASSYVPPPAPDYGTASSDVNAASGSYTVQKGDTLFKIAKQHYGDGKQYTRIVAANPGLDPAHLRVGQKIVVP